MAKEAKGEREKAREVLLALRAAASKSAKIVPICIYLGAKRLAEALYGVGFVEQIENEAFRALEKSNKVT